MSSPSPERRNDAASGNYDDDDDEYGDDENDDRRINVAMSSELEASILVAYRSMGLGTFGAGMRYLGMPLEKIALYMNSSQVTGSNQFGQSIRLTFREGYLAPYRVVGPASLVAWFMAYSVMGMSFQFFDRMLSGVMGVEPVWYGSEVMDPPPPPPPPTTTTTTREDVDDTRGVDSSHHRAKTVIKTLLAPVMAACLESIVANRAEVQRYFGPGQLATIESNLKWNPISRYLFAPAYVPNVMRNVIMCNTSFILTPITYRLYFPQENKSQGTLFCYGMGMNFTMNAFAITQQALWGRSLDYAAMDGGRNIRYSEVIRASLRKEGISAFFTVPKWFSRILMNAPVQGSLPWFYNNVLPLGEDGVFRVARWASASLSSSSSSSSLSSSFTPLSSTTGYGSKGKKQTSGTISCESREMRKRATGRGIYYDHRTSMFALPL
ncbi:hypothetical protein ACHAXA_010066 [Cyclostephanos tholiformis]|uniref:Uncharacterized protein n=1 Tax=Cyclostephanos tholiformis TaxID=382380 RepID=A0ABD3SFH3_9STRA